MTGYYDHVLGLIPASLVGVTGLLGAIGLSLSTAVFAGALVSLLFVLHALFVAAPTVSRADRSAEPRSSEPTASAGGAGPVQAD